MLAQVLLVHFHAFQTARLVQKWQSIKQVIISLEQYCFHLSV